MRIINTIEYNNGRTHVESDDKQFMLKVLKHFKKREEKKITDRASLEMQELDDQITYLEKEIAEEK